MVGYYFSFLSKFNLKILNTKANQILNTAINNKLDKKTTAGTHIKSINCVNVDQIYENTPQSNTETIKFQSQLNKLIKPNQSDLKIDKI